MINVNQYTWIKQCESSFIGGEPIFLVFVDDFIHTFKCPTKKNIGCPNQDMERSTCRIDYWHDLDDTLLFVTTTAGRFIPI